MEYQTMIKNVPLLMNNLDKKLLPAGTEINSYNKDISWHMTRPMNKMAYDPWIMNITHLKQWTSYNANEPHKWIISVNDTQLME